MRAKPPLASPVSLHTLRQSSPTRRALIVRDVSPQTLHHLRLRRIDTSLDIRPDQPLDVGAERTPVLRKAKLTGKPSRPTHGLAVKAGIHADRLLDHPPAAAA